MDEAIEDFNALKIRLNKFESNYKKCSQANKTKGYLEGRLKGIDEIWSSVCESDQIINSLKEDSNANIDYFENDEFGVMEEKYFQLVGQINDSLNAFNPQPPVNPNNNHNQNQQQGNESKVKLPKISLPSFSGSYHTWLSFKNRFTNLIHDSKSLSRVEKLEYLKSCVKGEAESAIQRYQITDANYDLAWKQLNDKYDNQRILQVTQVEAIIDYKIINKESAKELRELIDVTQESLENLNNLNVDVSTWNIMLIVLITRKLPLRTRELWEEELKPADVPTYKQLCEFLEKRYRTLESLELIGKSNTDNGGRTQYNNNRSNYTQPSNHRINCIVCNLNPHSLLVCEKFLNMSLANRSAFVNAKGLCRNCLAISHSLSECKSNKTCFKCNRKHHTLLHRDEPSMNYSNRGQFQSQLSQYPSNRVQSQTYFTNHSSRNIQPVQTNQSNRQRSQVTQDEQQYQENQSSLNPNADPYPIVNQSRTYVTNQSNRYTQPSQSNHQQNQMIQYNQQNPIHQSAQYNSINQENHSYNRRVLTTTSKSTPFLSATSPIIDHGSQEQTLFPTAIIQVKSAGGTIHNLRALLDQCSDEAYIKESVAKMLGLKLASIPAFEVTGLCDAVTSTVGKATKFEMIIQRKESMEVEANVVKTLIEILPRTNVAWPKDLFENIQMADPNFATPGNIDIMLGGQQYAELLLDGMLKKNGYLAQNTKLGWISSGKGNNRSQPIQRSACLITSKTKSTNEILKKFEKIEEEPKKRSFCGFTQSRWKSKENLSEESRRNYNIIQQNRSSYENPNQSKLYYPIFRSSNQSSSSMSQSTFNQSNQINANQSNMQNKQKLSLEEKRTELKDGDKNPIISKELLSMKQEDIQNHFVPSRPSLIDSNINRLCKSNQISRIVKNFEQRWRSESLLATTSIMIPIHIDKPLIDTTSK